MSTKTNAGEYYTSLLFGDDTYDLAISSNGKAVAINLRVLDFAVTLKGSKCANLRHLKKHFGNLLRKQKKFFRKKIGLKA